MIFKHLTVAAIISFIILWMIGHESLKSKAVAQEPADLIQPQVWQVLREAGEITREAAHGLAG